LSKGHGKNQQVDFRKLCKILYFKKIKQDWINVIDVMSGIFPRDSARPPNSRILTNLKKIYGKKSHAKHDLDPTTFP